MLRLVGLLVAALAYAILITPGVAAGEDEKPKVTVNEAEIYLGDSHDFQKPGVVDVDAVYDKIPEYREILDRNIDESNPRYLFLMRAASDRFRSAVEAVADDDGYDLIGGLGSIKIEGKKVPVITSRVIAKLPK
jgi:hypothetical protein